MTITNPLILIALLAIVVIFGIVWGMKLRRDRGTAERMVAANHDAAEQGASPAGAVPAAPARLIVDELPADESPVAEPPIANEPIAAAAPLDATPASIAADVPASPAAPATEASADLTRLKGLGPRLAATLAELGYSRIDQIAALGPDEAAALDARLGTFKGRMARDRWIEQAKLLSAGDTAAYEAAFGKLGG